MSGQYLFYVYIWQFVVFILTENVFNLKTIKKPDLRIWYKNLKKLLK